MENAKSKRVCMEMLMNLGDTLRPQSKTLVSTSRKSIIRSSKLKSLPSL
jgi:hypothetical protein